MKTTRYDIYVKDNYNKDGTFNVVIRDNELLARWLVDGGGDGDYTKSYYGLDEPQTIPYFSWQNTDYKPFIEAVNKKYNTACERAWLV